MTPRRARVGRERLDDRIGHERRLPAERGREFLREPAPLVGGRRRERAERTDRTMTRPRGRRDGLDEEMIDVRRTPHPSGRALDEHAEPISLLSPSSCQGKSGFKLVTIWTSSDSARRDFSELRSMRLRKPPFAHRAPWKLG
jgi:hypothetical protein